MEEQQATLTPIEEVVKRLNELGASLTVLKRNVRVFHWNIIGKQFIYVHEYLDELQDDIAECIDAVYEELRKGDLPLHATLSECLALSKITEVPSYDKYKAKDVFARILADINIIRNMTDSLSTFSDANKFWTCQDLANDILSKCNKVKYFMKSSLEDDD